MTFQEKNLQFDFDKNHWTYLLKFDGARDYKNASANLQNTKGVDISGILNKNSLVLMEVKDYRGHRIKNKPKFTDGQEALWLTTAHKFKDTISVIVGAARNSTHEKETFQSYLEFLKNEGRELVFILWLEQDTPLAKKNRKVKSDRQEYVLQQKLKRSLKWLTTKVKIIDKSTNLFSKSLSVTYI
ncbi:MAG TPA: hypothetical protein ENJ95_13930 [Bacteroidetes bacterium]|nr:hypothetical protein [Bacteroidota bacterium]